VTVVPPYLTDSSLCTYLTTISAVAVNGVAVPIVGPVSSYSCGAGTPETFTSDVITYFNSKFYYVAIAFCVIAGIELFNLLSAIYLTCVVHRNAAKEQGA